jgi:hypothetical protein
MNPNDLLDPENFPTFMVMSALISTAIGLIVYNVSGNVDYGLMTAFFLFAADYIGLKMLMKDDE